MFSIHPGVMIRLLRIGFACLAALVLSSCALLRQAALRNVTSVFTGGGGANAFVTDDDPELIRDALPFALKSYETLLAADPENEDLLLATGSAFVQYANGFLEAEANRLEDTDYARAHHLRVRAGKLYLRGRNYALRGLNLRYPGFEEHLRMDFDAELARLGKEDVPLAYWVAAGWGAAMAVDSGNMALVAELPIVEAIMRRALELDESFDGGALHEFFLAYEGGRTAAMGGSSERAKMHFDRAVALSNGQKATPYVIFASTVAVNDQNLGMFEELLKEALEVDPDAVAEWRLLNVLAQEKARWLLGRKAELFLDYEEEE